MSRMGKTIKIDDESYIAIEKMLMPRERFSDVVRRLLAIKAGVDQFIAEVEIMPEYNQHRSNPPQVLKIGEELK